VEGAKLGYTVGFDVVGVCVGPLVGTLLDGDDVGELDGVEIVGECVGDSEGEIVDVTVVDTEVLPDVVWVEDTVEDTVVEWEVVTVVENDVTSHEKFADDVSDITEFSAPDARTQDCSSLFSSFTILPY
jgi:hypothetical protein